MFPIPWNFPFRKKNGNLVNIGDAIDDGTELPVHGEGDAGKVLSVDENGNLEWSDEVAAEIQTLTNEVDTIVNDLSAKNIFDIEGWLNSLTITFTKNSNTYTITPKITAVSTSFVFSDNDIDVTISGTITNVTSSGMRLEILNSSDTVVATINNSVSFASGKGCKVRLNWSSDGMGDFTIEKPMIRPESIKDDTYVPYAMTNRELTELTEVKSYTIDASTYANAFNFRKIGKVVQVQLPAIKDDIPVASTVTIGDLPPDLIPLVNSQFQSEDPATGSNAVRYNFTSAGTLTIYRYSGTVGTGTLMNVGGTGVYLTQ